MGILPNTFPFTKSPETSPLPTKSKFLPKIPLMNSDESPTGMWIEQSTDVKDKVIYLERLNEDYRLEIERLKGLLQSKDLEINQLQIMLEGVPSYSSKKTQLKLKKRANDMGVNFSVDDIDF